MEKFISLNEEKQKKIINASLEAFGGNGYKKASIGDVATKAEIAKSMIFHYFKSKKNLYLYLVEFCLYYVTKEIELKFDKKEQDFFQRIKQIQAIKLQVMSHYPPMLDFIKSVYFEGSEEVATEVQEIFQNSKSEGFSILLKGADFTKFKEDVDPNKVLKVILWCGEGYINELPNKETFDIEKVCKEFDVYLELLKNCFYK